MDLQYLQEAVFLVNSRNLGLPSSFFLFILISIVEGVDVDTHVGSVVLLWGVRRQVYEFHIVRIGDF